MKTKIPMTPKQEHALEHFIVEGEKEPGMVRHHAMELKKRFFEEEEPPRPWIPPVVQLGLTDEQEDALWQVLGHLSQYPEGSQGHLKGVRLREALLDIKDTPPKPRSPKPPKPTPEQRVAIADAYYGLLGIYKAKMAPDFAVNLKKAFNL